MKSGESSVATEPSVAIALSRRTKRVGQPEVHPVDEREDVPDHLLRVDLGEARAVVAVEEVSQLGDELLLAFLRIPDAELGQPLGERLDVLVRDVDEEAGPLGDVLLGEAAGLPEIDEADPVRLEDEDVGRVRVGVEEAVAEDHRHPRLGQNLGEPAALLGRPAEHLEVGELGAVEVLEREHARSRVGPVDPRDPDMRVTGEVLAERLRVARLEPVVELLSNRAREFVHERLGVDEVERAHALLREPSGLVHQVQVALDLAVGPRTLNLDDDVAAVRKRRPVDLADRRRRRRDRIELLEEALDRLAELGADHVLHLLVRERRDVVLEPAELGDDVRRENVRPHREQLAELDEGRAELVEHLPQVAAAL